MTDSESSCFSWLWIPAFAGMTKKMTFYETINYDTFQKSHYEYVAQSLHNDIHRQAWWSESIAVGDESFVENIKQHLGFRAKGRKVKEAGENSQLREDAGAIMSILTLKIPI